MATSAIYIINSNGIVTGIVLAVYGSQNYGVS